MINLKQLNLALLSLSLCFLTVSASAGEKQPVLVEGQVIDYAMNLEPADEKSVTYTVKVLSVVADGGVVSETDSLIEIQGPWPTYWKVDDNGMVMHLEGPEYPTEEQKQNRNFELYRGSRGLFKLNEASTDQVKKTKGPKTFEPTCDKYDCYYNFVSAKASDIKIVGYGSEYTSLESLSSALGLKKMELATYPNIKGQSVKKKSASSVRTPTEEQSARYAKKLKGIAAREQSRLVRNQQANAQASKTASGQSLDVRITNQRYIEDPVGRFEFDIVASGTGVTFLDNFAYELEFSTFAFGNNLVETEAIQIDLAAPFQNGTYVPAMDFVRDEGPGTIRGSLSIDFLNNFLNRVQITSAEQPLLHFSIDVLNCAGDVGLVFTSIDEVSNVGNYYLTADADIFGNEQLYTYDPIVYQQPASFELCPPPGVNSFSPASITAGTESVLTITGLGFGETKGTGEVQFPKADDGGATYFERLDDLDYISWTDTEIKVHVPAKIRGLKGAPGSGIFKVLTSSGDIYDSPDPLIIPWGHGQITVEGGDVYEKAELRLVQPTSSIGENVYEFHVDEELANNAAMYDAVERALHDWSCATGMKWEIVGTTNLKATAEDGISLIYLDNTLPDGVFGSTERFDGHTCQDPSTGKWFVHFSEVDIVLRSNWPTSSGRTGWIVDVTRTLDIPADKIDFYTTIQHELGHAIGLRHANTEGDLMYFGHEQSLILASNRVDLFDSPDALEGAQAMMAYSSALDLSECANSLRMDPVFPEYCSDPNSSLAELYTNNSLTIYPNPAVGVVNVKDKGTTLRFEEVEILNQLGQQVFFDNRLQQSIGVGVTVDISGIRSGQYVVRTFDGTSHRYGRLVIR